MDWESEKGSLPIGVQVNGERVTEVIFRELTGNDISLIHDRQYRLRNPCKWVARTACLLLSSLGDSPVYSEFQAGEFKSFPPVILDLPSLDFDYLLVHSHTLNFGTLIEDLEFKCFACEASSIAEFDITNMPVIQDHDFPEISEVILTKPYVKGTGDTGIEGLEFTRVVVRVPKISDSLDQEEKYKPGQRDNTAYTHSIIASCIEKLETLDGQEYPKDLLRSSRGIIFDQLSPRDQRKISARLAGYPKLSMRVNVTCPECGVSQVLPLDPLLLFPRV